MAEQDDSTPAVLGRLTREVEEFVGSAGWDQGPQLFALVPTRGLLAEQPDLAERLDASAPLTPIAQESMPSDDLGEALAQIEWPETVHGCALAQEIVILPPEAQDAVDSAGEDTEGLERVAAAHPQRREARLVAAVHRDGTACCVLRLRGAHTATGGAAVADDEPEELVEHPELAPNLVDALRSTLEE